MNFILKKVTDKRWPWCCLLFFAMACHIKNQEDNPVAPQKAVTAEDQKINAALDRIYSTKKMVRQGDLIVRTGRDFTSEIMRQLSARDKTYSHCGIAAIEHDSVFVYHSIGGEWNPNQKLRRDPFEIFCNPFENRGFGVFRYKLSPRENAVLTDIVQKFYKRGIMFDMEFDLASDDKMYCTEFVYKAIEQAGHIKIGVSVTSVNQIKFVSPDDLYLNPGCMEIKRVIFNR